MEKCWAVGTDKSAKQCRKNKTLPHDNSEREIKRVSHASRRVVVIEVVVEPVVAPVPRVSVPVEVTDVEVAVVVAVLHTRFSVTPPFTLDPYRKCLGLNLIRYRNTVILCTKYLHFL